MVVLARYHTIYFKYLCLQDHQREIRCLPSVQWFRWSVNKVMEESWLLCKIFCFLSKVYSSCHCIVWGYDVALDKAPPTMRFTHAVELQPMVQSASRRETSKSWVGRLPRGKLPWSQAYFPPGKGIRRRKHFDSDSRKFGYEISNLMWK